MRLQPRFFIPDSSSFIKFIDAALLLEDLEYAAESRLKKQTEQHSLIVAPLEKVVEDEEEACGETSGNMDGGRGGDNPQYRHILLHTKVGVLSRRSVVS